VGVRRGAPLQSRGIGTLEISLLGISGPACARRAPPRRTAPGSSPGIRNGPSPYASVMRPANRPLLIGLGLAAVVCAWLAWSSHGSRDPRIDRTPEVTPGFEISSSQNLESILTDGPVAPESASRRAEAPTRMLELVVTREDGTPISEARIVVFQGKDPLATAVTDSEGRAKLDIRSRDASIAVLAQGHRLLSRRLENREGLETIVLPDELVVRGRVEVVGTPRKNFVLEG